jgi:hypothetical protein
MPDIPERLISIILHGLVSGVVGVGIFFTWRWLSLRYSRWPAADLSLLTAGAFLASETTLGPVPWYAWSGILILCISGIIKKNAASRWIFIIAGAAFLGFWSIQDLWVRGIVIVLTLWLSISFTSSAALLYLLLPFSMTGILTTVPDTEETGLLFGIVIAPMLIAWRPSSSSTAQVGTAPLAGLLAWVICCNGQGRPASIFVSVGCLGLLVTYPLLKKLTSEATQFLPLLAVLLQSLSIAIVLELARTTVYFDRAIVAACTAILIPTFVFIFLFFASDKEL